MCFHLMRELCSSWREGQHQDNILAVKKERAEVFTPALWRSSYISEADFISAIVGLAHEADYIPAI
jgi:hypothetical protein